MYARSMGSLRMRTVEQIAGLHLAAVLATSTPFHASAASDMETVIGTPCLLEYRTWFFESPRTRAPEFNWRTTEASEDDCRRAIGVHERIQQSQAAATRQEAADHEAATRRRIEAQEKERVAREEAWRAEDQATKAAEATRLQEARARRQKREQMPPVALGMTVADVLHRSQWGAPAARQRRTTSLGTVEVWVYTGRRALHFADGRVVAIDD